MVWRKWTTRDGVAKRGRLTVGSTRRRPGFAYILALGTASIVAVIGLSAIISIRLEGRTNSEEIWLAEARTLALSGLEHAQATVKANATWRTDYVHGVEAARHNLGGGVFYWTLYDSSVNNNLNAVMNGVVDIVSTGEVGPAVYSMRATLDFSAGNTTFVIGQGSKFREDMSAGP